MKARVYVSFKPTVLDPQGQTIQHALNGLGHKTVIGVRQGNFSRSSWPQARKRNAPRKKWQQIGHDVLANPVMEDFHVELID